MPPQPQDQDKSSARPDQMTSAEKGIAPPPRRNKVVLRWERDSKIKTSKCKVCGQRVKKYSHICKGCNIRVCSECTDADGISGPKYKAMASDYLNEGCWCGCPNRFNSAFAGNLPSPPERMLAVQGKKRKAAPTTPATAKEPSDSPEPSVDTKIDHEKPDDPFVEVPTTMTRTDHADLAMSRGLGQPIAEISTVEEQLLAGLNEINRPLASSSRPSRSRSAAAPAAYIEAESPPLTPLSGDKEVVPAPKKLRISKEGNRVGKQLHGKNIVVIGAGVIGLSIARELAQKAYASGSKDRITIVDINNAPCELTSGHSAGLLTIQGMDQEWLPLVEHSMLVWNELLNSKTFREQVRYGSHVRTVAEIGRDFHLPSKLEPFWFHEGLERRVVDDEASRGRLDSKRLANWLQEQCEQSGVQLRFEMHPTHIERDRAGNMVSVRIQKVDNAEKPELVTCSDLILAAGPFTTHLFSELFSTSELDLDNHLQHSQWIRINGRIEKGSSMAVITKQKDAHFAGPLSLIASHSKQTITVSCCQAVTANQRLKRRHAVEQLLGRSTELRELAANYLIIPGIDVKDKANQSSQGLSYISTGNGKKPVIGPVPSAALGLPKKTNGNVWLCYGFGNHGILLAPGIGRVMAQMLHGDETVDLYDFEVTKRKKAKGPAVSSKGKGRAVA